jgi:hypothetical protein
MGCMEFCSDCVKGDGCWVDAAIYGSDDDQACYSNCYTKCEEKLGSSSSLCDCETHGFCIFDCPENCGDLPKTLRRCYHRCDTMDKYDPFECYDKCQYCVNDLSCWTSIAYGSDEDVACYDNCYSDCGDYWRTNSWLCDCSHSACVLGCP